MAVDANGNVVPDTTDTSVPFSLSSITPQAAGVAGSLGSALYNANAIKDAASTLQQGLTTAEGTVAGYAKPFIDTGVAANQQLAAGLQSGGQFNTPFTMTDAANSEAMKTALAKGSETIQNSAAAKGGLLGTNTLAALSDYGQKTGAEYENQAFNQAMAQKQLTMGGLENLSGTGSSDAMAAGSNIANLQASGAQAGMNAVLGEANQYTQGVNNAISAYGALKPTTGTTGTGTTGAVSVPNVSVTTPGTVNTGTTTGAPAGAIIDPTTGQAVTNTPQQVATGTTKPSQMLDPQQSAAINQQNAATAPAGGAGAIATPVQQGSTQTTTVTPENAQLAQQYGITPSGITGTGVGDISPYNGALVIPDMTTGLPVNALTGIPELPIDSFTSWADLWGQLSTPTDSGNMGVGIDPLAEFLSTPAIDLGGSYAGMNLDALNNLDFSGWTPTIGMTTPTFDMGSAVDPYMTPIDTSYL